jgi:hypothetical protein
MPRITALTALAEALADGDLVAGVNVSDTSQAASGSTRKVSALQIYEYTVDKAEADGSGYRIAQIQVTDPNGDPLDTLGVGDGKAYLRVNANLNGWLLVGVAAHVSTVSSSGAITVQVHNVTDAVDMLSTALTIDASEKDSKDAATPAVVDANNDDVATGDELRIDLDGTGTDAKGLIVELVFGRA